MQAKDYLRWIVDEAHTAVVATVDREGRPVTCAIDMMDWDESGLYFLTAKGKNFYSRLKADESIAFTAIEPFPPKRTQNKRKKLNKNAEIRRTAIRRQKRQVQLQSLQANASQGQNGDGRYCKRLRDRQRHHPVQPPW